MIRLLVLNHFPTIYPPNTGGTLRYFNLYSQLSTYFDITLLSQKYTPELEGVNYSDTFREYRIPTNNIQYKIDEKLIREGIGPRFSTHSALSCALIQQPPAQFLFYYHHFYKNSAIIIHDSPFMLKYDVCFGMDNKPRIYDSHNHEAEFARHVWYGAKSHEYVNYVTRMEETLVKKAATVFATSEEDKNSFLEAFGVAKNKILLSPNGVNPEEWCERTGKPFAGPRVTALFIGSMHEPNIDIVKFIVYQLAEKCTGIDFLIAGRCGCQFSRLNIPNVKILGEVDDEQKRKLFSEVDIAINPAIFGTGTKIKTLEFLSAGIPLISTDVGVKGIDLSDGLHYFHATHDNFSQILNEISRDKKRLDYVAVNGQTYVDRNYSWKRVAESMKKQIEDLLILNENKMN